MSGWFDPEQMATLGRVTAASAELVGATVVGYFLGTWLDGWLGTSGLAWLGLILGLTAGFRSFLLMARRLKSALDDHDDPSEPPPPAPPV